MRDPKELTTALRAEFRPDELKVRDGLTYIPYPFVLRRLIEATDNQFDIDVLDVAHHPWRPTKNGGEQRLIEARVVLTIPPLGSRSATGYQIGGVNEAQLDLWKGAVSDGVKKAAQMFGVGLYLTGAYDENLAMRDLLVGDDEVVSGGVYPAPPSFTVRSQGGAAVQNPSPQHPRVTSLLPQAQPRAVATGGPKPMSDKQRTFIERLAAERGVTIEEVARHIEESPEGQRFGESWPDAVSSPMASRTVDWLKAEFTPLDELPNF